MAKKGCVPWNKGKRKPLGWCFRHATRRYRSPNGTVYCKVCQRVTNLAWQAENQGKVRLYRRRYAEKQRCATKSSS